MSLDADKVVVYVEGPRADELAPPVGVTVTDARSEARVPLASVRREPDLQLRHVGRGDRDRDAAARRALRRPHDGQSAGGYKLAIGESIAGRIVSAIVGAFAVGGILAIGGTGLIVATSIRRSRRRAAAQEPPNPFGR